MKRVWGKSPQKYESSREVSDQPAPSAQVATIPPPISSQEVGIKKVCDAYQLNINMFTRLTGFSPRAVAHWAKGRTPSESTQRRLVELKRLFDALPRLCGSVALQPWLRMRCVPIR